MSTIDQNLDALTSVHYELKKVLEELRADWSDQSPPATLAFAELGKAFVKFFPRLTQMERQRFSGEIENILLHGEEESKNAVATGLLEAVLTRTDDDAKLQNEVLAYLGIQARRYCDEWNRFHRG